MKLLEKYDWDVSTEVWDDNRNGRVDIFAEHPSVGCIGIEVKRTPKRQGGPISEGIAQLLNYRSYTYEEFDVDYWVLAPGFDVSTGPGGMPSERKKQVQIQLQMILVELKMGMLVRWKRSILFGKSPTPRINPRHPEYFDEADRRALNETINGRSWDAGEYEAGE
ncbi:MULTISPECIES: hypothetical protein [unclassified Halorubrum]|uniref:hypothetical protein n=1 Tax=unclassified Halorubrum TaxID=2642239 RepID=UPI0011408A49|nr:MULTISPECIES: hypothetical protein [unclassified Halorubrum]